MHSVSNLPFDNSYARLRANFHQKIAPTPVPDPYLVAFNADAAALIDLDPEAGHLPEFVEHFSGNRLLPGSEPLAMRYSGHQFGVYVPQLGDGRAILLGEVHNGRGEKWDLHLKGAGRTAYSRFGDGRAASSLSVSANTCAARPCTRWASRQRAPCASSARTWMSIVSLPKPGPCCWHGAVAHPLRDLRGLILPPGARCLKLLADYAIERHFPHLLGEADRYHLFFEEVVLRTARLVAQWQAAGFAHGVLNTDNMSILGLTLDYGPFGFMEDFEPGFILQSLRRNRPLRLRPTRGNRLLEPGLPGPGTLAARSPRGIAGDDQPLCR